MATCQGTHFSSRSMILRAVTILRGSSAISLKVSSILSQSCRPKESYHIGLVMGREEVGGEKEEVNGEEREEVNGEEEGEVNGEEEEEVNREVRRRGGSE